MEHKNQADVNVQKIWYLLGVNCKKKVASKVILDNKNHTDIDVGGVGGIYVAASI